MTASPSVVLVTGVSRYLGAHLAALEHLKRLEGEVLDLLASLGEMPALEGPGLTVDPHQLLGLGLAGVGVQAWRRRVS